MPSSSCRVYVYAHDDSSNCQRGSYDAILSVKQGHDTIQFTWIVEEWIHALCNIGSGLANLGLQSDNRRLVPTLDCEKMISTHCIDLSRQERQERQVLDARTGQVRKWLQTIPTYTQHLVFFYWPESS